MRQILWLSVCAVLFLLSLGIEARAQSFQGGLRGAVKESDRIIPGVTVTLVTTRLRCPLDAMGEQRL